MLCVVVLSLVPPSEASVFDPVAFLKLPPHCKAFYANAAKAGRLPGVVVDLSQYGTNLRSALGSASVYLNRYCPALVGLVREVERDPKKDDPLPNRKDNLEGILGGFQDQLEKTEWSQSNLWFKAEVLTNIGRTLKLLDEREKAIEVLTQAFALYPGYVPAYWELSRLYEEDNETVLAVEVLQKAKQGRLSRAALKRIDEKIGALEAAADLEQ